MMGLCKEELKLALSGGAQWQNKRQQAQTEIQETRFCCE